MISCPYCQSTAIQKRGHYEPTGEQRYTCKNCGHRFRKSTRRKAPKSTTVNSCLNCGKETHNPKFCSLKCSATYTNKFYQKRKAKPQFCKYCGKPLVGKRQTVCDECNPNIVDWMGRTVGDIQRSAKYQVSAHLRTIARSVYEKADLPRVCANCGYDKHVEICHIKPINSFPDDTPVAVINDLANLVALCPNCHWELDHGLLHV